MDSVTPPPFAVDPLDLRILHALQLDGRAPFRRIADVLGVSDRTVARRFDRLRASGLVRITVVPDSSRTGQGEWLVRVRVLPDVADAVADALARRPDTPWVCVVSSGTEIVCLFRTMDGAPAPLTGLTRRQGIVRVDAQRLLRNLTHHRRTAGDGTPVALTDLDRRLLPALAADGRAAYPQLARAVGWSESAVRRRLEELRASGTIRFDVATDPRLFGYSAQCLLWLSVTPSRLGPVAAALAGDPGTTFVGATTGPHQLLAVMVCRDDIALYDYVQWRVGLLDGVRSVETAVVTRSTGPFGLLLGAIPAGRGPGSRADHGPEPEPCRPDARPTP
ncbi:Lrp/AsnC family transcriptional regulator [Streptomyces caatingaensis]|uniref:Lrp/AsnC family transcriptional regulator n=1 Tax=Streptomyces caatingaensis TaxID=1678637 RepID=UPI00099B3957|nr:AsnC family transcriptional regulator [Streptomyces caatingaensis]